MGHFDCQRKIDMLIVVIRKGTCWLSYERDKLINIEKGHAGCHMKRDHMINIGKGTTQIDGHKKRNMLLVIRKGMYWLL